MAERRARWAGSPWWPCETRMQPGTAHRTGPGDLQLLATLWTHAVGFLLHAVLTGVVRFVKSIYLWNSQQRKIAPEWNHTVSSLNMQRAYAYEGLCNMWKTTERQVCSLGQLRAPLLFSEKENLTWEKLWNEMNDLMGQRRSRKCH